MSPSRFGPIHSWLKSLQRATEIALEMVTRHGVDETIGQRTYTPPSQPFLALPRGSDHDQAAEITTREIDVAVCAKLAKIKPFWL